MFQATMAPTDTEKLEWQTGEIIRFLLEDELECVETDGPVLSEDFDPVAIANKLRTVADSLNEDAKFKAALNGLKQAAVQEAAEAAFRDGVEALCEAQVSQRAEVAPEMQLIRASVAFGLYVKRSSPDLKNKVHSAMTAFLNRRVGSWVSQQGGWEKVASG